MYCTISLALNGRFDLLLFNPTVYLMMHDLRSMIHENDMSIFRCSLLNKFKTDQCQAA